MCGGRGKRANTFSCHVVKEREGAGEERGACVPLPANPARLAAERPAAVWELVWEIGGSGMVDYFQLPIQFFQLTVILVRFSFAGFPLEGGGGGGV